MSPSVSTWLRRSGFTAIAQSVTGSNNSPPKPKPQSPPPGGKTNYHAVRRAAYYAKAGCRKQKAGLWTLYLEASRGAAVASASDFTERPRGRESRHATRRSQESQECKIRQESKSQLRVKSDAESSLRWHELTSGNAGKCKHAARCNH